MPNLTTPVPPKLMGNTEQDLNKIRQWGAALIDELSYLFQNLDAGNVSEAASVKAENIDTATARISNAQIGVLTADKLTAGTVNTDNVTVSDSDGTMELTGSRFTVSDGNRVRMLAEYDREDDQFRFVLFDGDGAPGMYMDSGGDAVFRGSVQSSSVYSSTMVGTDREDYQNTEGDVFALVDPTGIKVMQDKNHVRKQKIGMTVADDGTAYLVLGAGNGQGSRNINGVVYTNGSFRAEKNESYAALGLSGYAPQIQFWEDGEELRLSGRRILINGTDLEARLTALEERL